MKLMEEICVEYAQFFDKFINGDLSVDAFQIGYLEKFKKERRHLSVPLYKLLESVFGDVDSFTLDPELHRERPHFYLDENSLRERVACASANLALICRARPTGDKI